MGNKSQSLMMMNNLGDLYYTQERWQDALGIFDQLVEGATAIGDMQLRAFGLANSGDSLALMGKFDEAERRITEALQLFQYLGEVRLILGTYAIMGTFYKAKKDYAKAREYFEKAIEGQKRLEILQNLSVILWDYADLEEQAGNKARAKELYMQSLEYAKKMAEKKRIEKIKEKLKTM
jgi:tetratricopeptide (TPR) repeat protein